MQSRRISTAVLALMSAAVLAACSNDDDNPVGTNNDNTTVRFINATSDELNLDIASSGTVGSGNGDLAYGQASSCIKVNNEDPQLAVREAGSTTAFSGFTPSFQEGETYTVLVTGTADAPVFTTLNDAFETPSTGNAGVRLINATSSATSGTGTWDIYINPTDPLGTPSATAIARNAATTYLAVPGGETNTLRLTEAGQVETLQDIAVPSITAGTVRTLVVTDAATGTTELRTTTLEACS